MTCQRDPIMRHQNTERSATFPPHPAGLHGFNGYKAGTVLLTPDTHTIEIDYIQVHCQHAALAFFHLSRG